MQMLASRLFQIIVAVNLGQFLFQDGFAQLHSGQFLIALIFAQSSVHLKCIVSLELLSAVGTVWLLLEPIDQTLRVEQVLAIGYSHIFFRLYGAETDHTV